MFGKKHFFSLSARPVVLPRITQRPASCGANGARRLFARCACYSFS